eukprot:3515888-Alexandrium_andersonii.AAC.1
MPSCAGVPRRAACNARATPGALWRRHFSQRAMRPAFLQRLGRAQRSMRPAFHAAPGPRPALRAAGLSCHVWITPSASRGR